MADASRYSVPSGVHRVEDTVQRSRFITTVARASDAEDAQAFVARVRAEMPDATHHCWAFVAGPPGDTARIGMSDDGEPHGTAGRPMLTTLLHGGIGEIVAVCTRYFGGVKLGTGGLSRAYSGAVKHALETLPTEEKVDRVGLTLTIGYSDVDGVRRLVERAGAIVEDETFAEEVTFVVAVPSPARGEFEEALAELTQGRARVDTA